MSPEAPAAARMLRVQLGERAYPLLIGPGLLRRPTLWASAVRGRHVLVVTDRNVAAHWLAPVLEALAGREVATEVLPPGEQEKSLARLGSLLDRLAALGASRDATVLALGGGVVGDLAGFAAACWMRGIAFVQLPTTLLAMVDSSVGGKTAVNLPAGKNLVGAFHQPAAVVADTDTLSTLPQRELAAGLAEVVKYAAIADKAFMDWLERHADALVARDPDRLAEAIETSCRHKAAIVARDETEQGERALLNFGHTFGHAIEGVAGYGNLLHGEAVAIGMVLAARLSVSLDRAPAADTERLAALLARLGLPIALPAQLDPDALLAAMRLDKKAVSGRLRLVLWQGAGRADIVDGVEDGAIRAVLDG